MPITDADLVKRAMMNLRNHEYDSRPRWALVKDVFGVGSTRAEDLCERFGLDPDEKILGQVPS